MESSIKIAIADDHTLLRQGVCEILSKYGFDIIIEAKSGTELIQKLEQAAVLPDICIMDINMPGLNGYLTLEQLKKKWPEIKTLALTMFDNEFSIIKMLSIGANGYLLKDSSPRELQQALMSIYEDDFYHSELVTSRLYKSIRSRNVYKLPKITAKEMEFLSLCCSDLTYKEMAEKMHLSPRTVEGYGETLCEKLNVKSRSGLVMYALRIGIVPYSEQ